MNLEGSLQSIQQRNQQPMKEPSNLNILPPQKISHQERGKALFQKLEQNPTRQFERFESLGVYQMLGQITYLQIWKQIGGPHSNFITSRSKIHLERLNKIAQLKLTWEYRSNHKKQNKLKQNNKNITNPNDSKGIIESLHRFIGSLWKNQTTSKVNKENQNDKIMINNKSEAQSKEYFGFSRFFAKEAQIKYEQEEHERLKSQ